jgi:prepilin peptidase CpaA
MIFTVGNLLLLVMLIIAAITDIRSHRIPNWLTFPAMIVGVGFNVISAGAAGFVFGLGGLLLGMGLLIVFYALGGMGAGDVKLMGAVGSMLGPQMVLWAAFYTAIFGGIYAVGVILFHPRLREKRRAVAEAFKNFIFYRTFNYNKPAEEENVPKLCYGVAIAIGTIAAVVLKSV